MRTLKGSWKVAVAFRGTCEATSAFLTISTDLLPPPVSVMFLSCVISHLAIMLAQLPGTSNNQHAPCSLLAACTALWHLQPVPPWGTCGPGLATSMGTPRERCKVGKRRCKLCRCLLAAGEEGQKLGLKWGGEALVPLRAFDQVLVNTRCWWLLGFQQLSHCLRTESFSASSHKPQMIPGEAAQAD